MVLVHQENFDLQAWLSHLHDRGNLIKVHTPMDPKYQMAGCAKELEGHKPVFFTQSTGSQLPVVMGLYWNRDILADLFGCSAGELPFLLAEAIRRWQLDPIEPVVLKDGLANEVVEFEVDLTQLPVPTHALEDGGPYFSSCVVIARDPDTGVRNASVHRLMLSGKNRLTMLMDEGRHLKDYFERAEKRGQSLEITINNGVDPTFYLAAMTPAVAAPLDRDELGVASALKGRPAELLASQTVQVEGIASAQFILEGEIIPYVREPEGPFAELTQYYGAAGDRWVVRVNALTSRRKPIFHSILPGREIAVSLAVMGEAGLYNFIKAQVPDLTAVRLTEGGCGRYHAVLQLRKRREGSQNNAILAAFVGFPSLQIVTAVDDDVNINDPEEVEWALSTRLQAPGGILQVSKTLGHELNPATIDGLATKVGFDATVPLPRDRRFDRVRMQKVDLAGLDIEGLSV